MSIPIHVITGFLGSGKTSFLKHYLEKFGNDRKIAIVQNEFAPVGVDGEDIKSGGDYQILEINNGSAFCVCLLGTFKTSLARFVEENQPEEILMEASGLSDPIEISRIFQAPEFNGNIYLEHVWCLLDAVNFKKAGALQNRIDRQIRIADTVIVNKIDLFDGDIETVLQQVRKANPFVKVKTASYGKIEITDFSRTVGFFSAEKNSPAGGRPQLRSEVIKTVKEIDENKLTDFLESIKHDCIRYKGYVKIKRNKTCMVQGLYDKYALKYVNPKQEPTEFVVICSQAVETDFQNKFDDYCLK